MYTIKLICQILIIFEIIRTTLIMKKGFDIRYLIFIMTQTILLIPFAVKTIYIINLVIYMCNDLAYDRKTIGISNRFNNTLNIINAFAFVILYYINV